MESEGILQTIAELAVALAGFSSIVIALRGTGPHAWAPQDRIGLGVVLIASLGALVCALLPFPLDAFGVAPDTSWRVATAVLALSMGGATAHLGLRALRHSPRTPKLFWTFIGSGLVLALFLLAYASGAVPVAGPGMLLVGLLWVLLAAFAQLITFLIFT